jgi:hypothetical protein
VRPAILHGAADIWIIGDSNLRDADLEHVPKTCLMEVFPGAQCADVVNIINQTNFRRPTTIIAAIGIEHRHTATDISTMCERMTRSEDHNVYAMGVSISPQLPAEEQNVLSDFNRQLHQIFANKYIPPLAADDTHIGSDGLYYTKETASKVMERIAAHISGKQQPLNPTGTAGTRQT